MVLMLVMSYLMMSHTLSVMICMYILCVCVYSTWINNDNKSARMKHNIVVEARLPSGILIIHKNSIHLILKESAVIIGIY